ncbi:class I SAM-dependent methyltransferase [Streptomyces sp. SP17KL33]|uniref:class I SAM-dependent methyltransferase n=1 Tax=Streptomyces sp. SP17KL33 TaxID=3002534 RepID=UPI002E7A0282|nr:class I SAM-dependent methyltransferase [Streptomyces sp. SP17KL33]MEE1830341.1 class I SAM-dependent methyltransferase [Streptomyces sp. SP17KL33]
MYQPGHDRNVGHHPHEGRPADGPARGHLDGRPIDLDHISRLYRTFAEDLDRARERQRTLLAPPTSMKAQLDDMEAEITYLLLREARPETVVEIGTFHGWSTTWILRALRDNGTGHLHSYDIVDHVVREVPDSLSTGRWTFTQGDARQNLEKIPASTADFLFIDAAHSASFARWYLRELFPQLRAGIPVCVHDVFHGRRALPFTEGAVVLRWLAERENVFFTASRAHAPEIHDRLNDIKRSLALGHPVRESNDNPMIFFTLR